jgi:hypothetical protein
LPAVILETAVHLGNEQISIDEPILEVEQRAAAPDSPTAIGLPEVEWSVLPASYSTWWPVATGSRVACGWFPGRPASRAVFVGPRPPMRYTADGPAAMSQPFRLSA